jgi:L-asparaginase
MTKPKILLLKTGGTIAQKPDLNGVLQISSDDYLEKIEGLSELVDLHVTDVGSIDSTNMETNLRCFAEKKEAKDRTDIAHLIYDNALDYDGFVVVHGTDTMTETAAALTYMLPDFRKPIVLTGSQKSMWVPRSDGGNNLYTAVQTATKDLGEVVISFGNSVLRGARAKKLNEEGYEAFGTPGIEPIGKVTALSEGVKLANHRIRREEFVPRIFTDFDTRIFNYDIVSGANIDDILITIIESDKVQGILMGGFGAGNIPTRLMPFLRIAKNNDKPIFVYTKCNLGSADMGIYSVGDLALKEGARSALDMTPEALGQKLMYSLGRANSKKLKGKRKLDFIEAIIKTPYNGDINIKKERR